MKKLKSMLGGLLVGLVMLSSVIFASDSYIPITNSWGLIDTIPNVASINSIVTDVSGNIYVGTGSSTIKEGFVYKMPYGGSVWQRLGGANPDNAMIAAVAVDDNGSVYAGSGLKGHVYKISSGTNEWRLLGEAIPSGHPVEKLAVGPDGALYAGISSGMGSIYKITPENGQKWLPIIGDGRSPGGGVVSLVTNKKNNIYIGTRTGNVYKLAHGDNQWQQIGTPITINGRRASVEALIVDSKENVYVGSSFGNIFKMPNGGKAWQHLGIVLDKNRVNTLAVDANDNLYAGTGSSSAGSIYRMPDGGKQWQDFGKSPDNNIVRGIVVDINNNLYVGTSAAKLYKVQVNSSRRYTVSIENKTSDFTFQWARIAFHDKIDNQGRCSGEVLGPEGSTRDISAGQIRHFSPLITTNKQAYCLRVQVIYDEEFGMGCYVFHKIPDEVRNMSIELLKPSGPQPGCAWLTVKNHSL